MRRSSTHFLLSISLIISAFLILIAPIARLIKPFLPFTGYLLGIDKPTSYLILLGNDAEMRANGGFAGSYTKLIVNYPSFDLSFEDIYVPNGQLKGYVTPPQPVQDAFQHGSWELANADWEPDFPTTAATLRWFMEKGNEINPDLLAIINLTTIKKILDVVGSFSVPEFDAEITPDNFYLFLQGKVELNFFPGSTQKKDALTAVGHALTDKVLSLPLTKKIQIAQILYSDLENQNIVINSQNDAFQKLLEDYNFAGKLSSTTKDTYLLVETNLGANKANAFVTRNTNHTISFGTGSVTHKVTVDFRNSSLEANPNPPFHYGGNYIVYLRFYLPPNAQNIQVASASSAIKFVSAEKFGFTEIGFWQTTPAQNQTQVTLSYSLPISPKDYSLTILKQHSLVSSPQTINLNGKTYQTNLENDFRLLK